MGEFFDSQFNEQVDGQAANQRQDKCQQGNVNMQQQGECLADDRGHRAVGHINNDACPTETDGAFPIDRRDFLNSQKQENTQRRQHKIAVVVVGAVQRYDIFPLPKKSNAAAQDQENPQAPGFDLQFLLGEELPDEHPKQRHRDTEDRSKKEIDILDNGIDGSAGNDGIITGSQGRQTEKGKNDNKDRKILSQQFAKSANCQGTPNGSSEKPGSNKGAGEE